MKFEFQMEQDEQMIHGKIEADSEEIATEMVKKWRIYRQGYYQQRAI